MKGHHPRGSVDNNVSELRGFPQILVKEEPDRDRIDPLVAPFMKCPDRAAYPIGTLDNLPTKNDRDAPLSAFVWALLLWLLR